MGSSRGIILILAGPSDVHAFCVARELAQLGAATKFLDTRLLGPDVAFSYSIAGTSSARIQCLDGSMVSLEDVSTIWRRRPFRARLPVIMDQEYKWFGQQEWSEALEGALDSLGTRQVNRGSAELAATKTRQLELAHRLGLRVPETLITNDPGQVDAFLDRHRNRVVHKVMTNFPGRLLETRRWSAKDRAALADLPLVPAMFQEEIAGPADIRATVVGERIFAARIETARGRADVDSRLDLDAPCEVYGLPDGTAELLLRLMRELGLEYGAIDLRVAEDGGHVFLEINPQGQFLYIEILTGLPISRGLAELLAC